MTNNENGRGRISFRWSDRQVAVRVSDSEMDIIAKIGERIGSDSTSETMRYIVRFLLMEIGLYGQIPSSSGEHIIDRMADTLKLETASEAVRFAIHYIDVRDCVGDVIVLEDDLVEILKAK